MSQGRTVRLFLADGTPTGVLTAEIMNWTGHILVTPRSRLADALKRPEASRTGVYLLVGDDILQPHRPRVYVGEGDSVLDRIKSHSKDITKDFWTHACIITSKDANLTKAHVRYLENRILDLIKASGRGNTANGNEPSVKSLPESDIADMEFFISQLQIALPVVGMDVLRPKPSTHSNLSSDVSDRLASANALKLVLSSKKSLVNAIAFESDGELTVLAGSTASNRQFTSNAYSARRQELIESGALQPTDNVDIYTLTSDTTFRSPSEAAAILLNRNANGRTEWHIHSTGQTLKDWQDDQLDNITSS